MSYFRLSAISTRQREVESCLTRQQDCHIGSIVPAYAYGRTSTSSVYISREVSASGLLHRIFNPLHPQRSTHPNGSTNAPAIVLAWPILCFTAPPSASDEEKEHRKLKGGFALPRGRRRSCFRRFKKRSCGQSGLQSWQIRQSEPTRAYLLSVTTGGSASADRPLYDAHPKLYPSQIYSISQCL